MSKIKHYTAGRDINIILANLLRTGVVLSMLIVLTGGIFYLSANGSATADYATFNPEVAVFDSIPAILKGLMAWKSGSVIQCGILLLIFTPILRVVFSVYNFVLERDYLYVIIGMIVLGIITVSLNSGLAH